MQEFALNGPTATGIMKRCETVTFVIFVYFDHGSSLSLSDRIAVCSLWQSASNCGYSTTGTLLHSDKRHVLMQISCFFCCCCCCCWVETAATSVDCGSNCWQKSPKSLAAQSRITMFESAYTGTVHNTPSTVNNNELGCRRETARRSSATCRQRKWQLLIECLTRTAKQHCSLRVSETRYKYCCPAFLQPTRLLLAATVLISTDSLSWPKSLLANRLLTADDLTGMSVIVWTTVMHFENRFLYAFCADRMRKHMRSQRLSYRPTYIFLKRYNAVTEIMTIPVFNRLMQRWNIGYHLYRRVTDGLRTDRQTTPPMLKSRCSIDKRD